MPNNNQQVEMNSRARRPNVYTTPLAVRRRKCTNYGKAWKTLIMLAFLIALAASGVAVYSLLKVLKLPDQSTLRGANRDRTSEPLDLRFMTMNKTLLGQQDELENIQESLSKLEKYMKRENATISRIVSVAKVTKTKNDREQLRIRASQQSHARAINRIKSVLTNLNKTLVKRFHVINIRANQWRRLLNNISRTANEERISLDERIELNNEGIQTLRQDIGWIPLYNGYEYFIKRSGSSFNASRKFCQSKGGDLATVGVRRNSSRTYLTEKFLPTKTRYSVWIGLTDIESEGIYKWLDGVQATTSNTNFAPGEPNNYRGTQDCCYIQKLEDKYQMADYHCARELSALCERRVPE